MLLFLLSTLLITSCFLISTISLFSSAWTSFEINSQIYTHSLYYNLKSPEKYSYANYECLSALSCNDSQEPDLCQISLKLEKAKSYYLPFEILSIAINLMILERLVLKVFRKPHGSLSFFLMLVWIFPLIKSIGLLCFLLISNVSLEDSQKNGEIHAEIGVNLAIAGSGLSIISSLLIIIGKIHNFHTVIKFDIKVSTAKFLKPMIIFTISQVMLALSYIYPTARYNDFSEITTNMHYVNHIDTLDNLSISCIQGQECLTSDETCSVFNSLSSIEKSLFALEIVKYIFLFLWAESFLHVFLKIRLGTNLLNYSYPAIYLVLNLTEFIFYVVKSNISYGAECEIENFKTGYQLCAELGLTFYIIGLVFVFLTTITYILTLAVYCAKIEANNKINAKHESIELKQSQSKVMPFNNTVENFGDNTQSDLKIKDDVKTEDATTIMRENEKCSRCKLPFADKELGITEKGKKMHYKCFIISES